MGATNAPPGELQAFSHEWKRRPKASEAIAWHLRFQRVEQGRIREACGLIRRLLKHPRLARIVFTHPISGRLPMCLVRKPSEVDAEELREIILRMQPYMAGYGQYHAELALHLLGDGEAMDRAGVILEQCVRGMNR